MVRTRSKRTIVPLARNDEFALADHQLMAARDPCASIRALLDTKTEGFIGRPYSLWRDDPELARALNDGLLPRKD